MAFQKESFAPHQVKMMVGASLQLQGLEDGVLQAQQKLEDIRRAKIVVATAGSFENAMIKVMELPHSNGVFLGVVLCALVPLNTKNM